MPRRRKSAKTISQSSANIYDILPSESLSSYSEPDSSQTAGSSRTLSSDESTSPSNRLDYYGDRGGKSALNEVSDPNDAEIRFRTTRSRAEKRRWRRSLCQARREGLLGLSRGSSSSFRGGFGRGSTSDFGGGSSSDSEMSPSRTPRARTPSQSVPNEPQSSEHSQNSPPISGILLHAIERFWDLERNSDNSQNTDISGNNSFFSTAPDPSNLGQAADHASLMLEVFSHVKPVDDRHLTAVQKTLVTTALTSVLEITQQFRILEISANEPLEPLPAAHDEALNVYSGCIVCFARVADMLLMPCRHLILCEVCCDKIDGKKAEVRNSVQIKPMRCPVCRNDVLERIRIYRG